MNCLMCGAPTKLGDAFALPFLILTDGHYQNLYACSRVCRDEWWSERHSADARKQVKEIQAELSAPKPMEVKQ